MDMDMDVMLKKTLHVFLLWMVFSWKCIACKNSNLTANPLLVAQGGSITLTSKYVGTGTVTAISWLNGSNADILTLTAGSTVPKCDVFATVNASFDPARLHYTCDTTSNIYSLRIDPVQDRDINVKWSCTFLDPSPDTDYSIFTIREAGSSTMRINNTTTSKSSGMNVKGTIRSAPFIAILIAGVMLYI